MTVFYVHRNGGPGTPISMAGEHQQPGYADEALDDPTNAEIPAYRAIVTAPAAPPRPTPRAWLERLSPATQLSLETAALSNASVSLWLRKATAASDGIDVTLPETQAGVAAMVSAGLLTTAEQAALLAA